MRFRVLGPLEVTAPDGTRIELGSSKLRALLTLLLADAGRVVPLDRITETLWFGEPPASATGTLQSYVSHLRRLLEPDRAPRAEPRVLLTRPPGYLLAVGAEDLDILRFDQLLAEGERLLQQGDPAAAERTLCTALELWRGEPLAELGEDPAVAADRARLGELRLVATERYADALLALHRPDAAVVELERLVQAHPLRERVWGSLMLALYRAGRQADALGAYASCRDLLRDQLGIDPGPGLQRLERSILLQDPAVDAPPAPPAPAPPPAPVPTAPSADRGQRFGFVGCGDERALLHDRLTAAVTGRGAVVLVEGEAGIGKTRLAEEVTAAIPARVVWSRCADEGGVPALWPWCQVLTALGAPAMNGTAAVGTGDADSRRRELFDQLVGRLLDAANRSP